MLIFHYIPIIIATERTFKFTQEQIKKEVSLETKNKLLELDLAEFGPYQMDYTRNGRHLLLGGSKGHIAAMNWESAKLHCKNSISFFFQEEQQFI